MQWAPVDVHSCVNGKVYNYIRPCVVSDIIQKGEHFKNKVKSCWGLTHTHTSVHARTHTNIHIHTHSQAHTHTPVIGLLYKKHLVQLSSAKSPLGASAVVTQWHYHTADEASANCHYHEAVGPAVSTLHWNSLLLVTSSASLQ